MLCAQSVSLFISSFIPCHPTSSLLILVNFLSWRLPLRGQVQDISQPSSFLTPPHHLLLLAPSSGSCPHSQLAGLRLPFPSCTSAATRPNAECFRGLCSWQCHQASTFSCHLCADDPPHDTYSADVSSKLSRDACSLMHTHPPFLSPSGFLFWTTHSPRADT